MLSLRWMFSALLVGAALMAADAPAQALPKVTLSSQQLTWAMEFVGASSQPKLVTVTNVSGEVVPIYVERNGWVCAGAGPCGGPYGWDTDFPFTTTCKGSIPVGGSCSVQVTFTPTAPGPRRSSIIVGAGGQLFTISTSGDGIVSVVSVPHIGWAGLMMLITAVGASGLIVLRIAAPHNRKFERTPVGVAPVREALHGAAQLGR